MVSHLFIVLARTRSHTYFRLLVVNSAAFGTAGQSMPHATNAALYTISYMEVSTVIMTHMYPDYTPSIKEALQLFQPEAKA